MMHICTHNVFLKHICTKAENFAHKLQDLRWNTAYGYFKPSFLNCFPSSCEDKMTVRTIIRAENRILVNSEEINMFLLKMELNKSVFLRSVSVKTMIC